MKKRNNFFTKIKRRYKRTSKEYLIRRKIVAFAVDYFYITFFVLYLLSHILIHFTNQYLIEVLYKYTESCRGLLFFAPLAMIMLFYDLKTYNHKK